MTVSFLGVPFAAPPTGALRWAPPVKPEVVAGVVPARAFAAACMQGRRIVDWYRDLAARFGADPDVIEAPEFSEDCLYLNIWTPDTRRRADLPVMVWIHGGSNTAGWSYEPNYIGERLARQGVVVVTIAYRLGVFGFFSHPDLEDSNFGLLDQVAALQWVRDNIQRFGGDPDNVTIFGESAGADAVGSLIVSPLGRGLFRRAIHQSGGSGLLMQGHRDGESSRGAALFAELGMESSVHSLNDARQMAADAVLAAAEKVYEGRHFGPVIDGHSLREPPIQTLEKGDVPAIDLIVGTNAHEWLMDLDSDIEWNDVEAWIDRNTVSHRDELLGELRRFGTARHALDRLITAQGFVCPSLMLAEKVNQAGGSARVYYFTRQREGELGVTMGAYHGAEIPYIFDTHDAWLPTTADDRILTDAMGSYWVAFARAGAPTGGLWPTFEVESMMTLELGDRIGAVRHPDSGLCQMLPPATPQE